MIDKTKIYTEAELSEELKDFKYINDFGAQNGSQLRLATDNVDYIIKENDRIALSLILGDEMTLIIAKIEDVLVMNKKPVENTEHENVYKTEEYLNEL